MPLPNVVKSLIVETANSRPAKKTAMPKKDVPSTILSGCQPEQYSNINGMTTVTWKGSAMMALKALNHNDSFSFFIMSDFSCKGTKNRIIIITFAPSFNEKFGIAMAYMNKYQSDEYRRDELIRIIEHSVEKLTLAELEALYYDMTTKSYINDN